MTACETASRWSSALELSKQSINSRVQVDFMAMNSILDYLGIFIIPSKKRKLADLGGDFQYFGSFYSEKLGEAFYF